MDSSRGSLAETGVKVVDMSQKHRTNFHIDVLTATATDLRQLLDRGEVFSSDLVKDYLRQIDRHNHKGMELRAVISTAPEEDLLRQACALDRERAEGRARGPMHGIPVIIKASQIPKRATVVHRLTSFLGHFQYPTRSRNGDHLRLLRLDGGQTS